MAALLRATALMAAALMAAALMAAAPMAAAAPSNAAAAELTPCRLKGIEREVRCGRIEVPEDPDRTDGRRIGIHFAVVPALAKNKSPDPLFVLAGGPGQAATRVAALMQPTLSRLNARRDIVYVDQRGTGDSNPLVCEQGKKLLSLSESADPLRAVDQLSACARQAADRADTRQYATWIAMRDLDAVRAALGAERINLWGGSYGTRAALEYLRQFPQHVRSVVLDGVAPATMALPASFAVDSEAALQRLVEACAADTACRTHYPQLDGDIKRLLFVAERGTRVSVTHPLTGEGETLPLDRSVLAGLLRAPLYAPQLAAVLPFALAQAGRGNYDPLFALTSALTARMGENFAGLMHFAVVCAEDMPRVDAPARAAAAATRFGTGFLDLYERACRQVPVRPVPAAFYEPPRADVPVLILSGGADPVTPPRHGDSVAASLPRALHLTAPHLGHGVTQHGCAPELIGRFVRQADAPGRGPFAGLEDGKEAGCLARMPAPVVFRPPAFITP
ncbi:MAG: alpha/beta hydrolase [Burkholderiaceae bacterium]|nr:alpha/beta hydrolase [Burkholderiaceae bacterium]